MNYSAKQEAEGKLRYVLHGSGVGSKERSDPTCEAAPAASPVSSVSSPCPAGWWRPSAKRLLGASSTQPCPHTSQSLAFPTMPSPRGRTPAQHQVPLMSIQSQSTVITTAQAAASPHMAELHTALCQLCTYSRSPPSGWFPVPGGTFKGARLPSNLRVRQAGCCTTAVGLEVSVPVTAGCLWSQCFSAGTEGRSPP